MCINCGQPDYVRCNCASQQPMCNQCSPNNVCGGGYMDSSCVRYNLLNQYPSRLINLGLPNNTPVSTILEDIDAYLGKIQGTVFTPVSSNAIDLTLEPNGSGGNNLIAVLIISEASGNVAVINPDGLYVPDVRDWKVSVSEGDTPGYLPNKVIGGTDGIVSLSTGIDPSGTSLVLFQPSLNVIALADNVAFENALANNSNFISQLTSNSQFKTDNSVAISPDSGNIIVQHSNGLYASGGTSAVANNGLSVSGSDIQLGGPLIKNTVIGMSSGAWYLQFNSTPKVVIGESAPSGGSIFEVDNTYANGFNLNAAAVFNTTTVLRATGGGVGSFSDLFLTSGTDTDTGVKAGSYGQIFFNGSVTLNDAAPEAAYAGVHGIIVPEGTGTVVTATTTIPAGVMGGSFASDNVTITNLAALSARAIYQSPGGAAFSGTITNYYGLHIEDLATGLGSHVTNKYAIYQVGTGDISRFFGPVQNAGGTTQFTSDARVKENVENFKRGLADIEKISTKTFNYTYNKGKKVTGIIAQELEAIIPEAIEKTSFSTPTGESFEDFRMVDQNVLFYTMLNAIKELSARVAYLEAK